MKKAWPSDPWPEIRSLTQVLLDREVERDVALAGRSDGDLLHVGDALPAEHRPALRQRDAFDRELHALVVKRRDERLVDQAAVVDAQVDAGLPRLAAVGGRAADALAVAGLVAAPGSIEPFAAAARRRADSTGRGAARARESSRRSA